MNHFIGKISIGLFLLLSLGFMILEIARTWQPKEHATAQTAPAGETAPETQQNPQEIRFYPAVPASLPNLYDGYLFNGERYLADPAKYPEQVAEKEKDAASLEFDQLMYNGSLIIGDAAKALISYPEPIKMPATKNPASRRKNTKTAQRLQKSRMIRQTVEPGDVIGGYRVASILPEKIIFQRNAEHIEKMLHDPEKKRIAVPKRKPLPRMAARPGTAVNARKRVISRSDKSPASRKVVRRPTVIRRKPQ